MSPRLPNRSPGSPLSPKLDSLAIPSQARRMAQRQHGSTATSGSLWLPSLPRFHPANFPSQHTSVANTPATGPNSPQAPVSPRSQQTEYSEAQKQQYMYQRELVSSAARGGGRLPSGAKPASPRLVPLGSPGPVTPLDLEGQDGYLLAGAGSPSYVNEATKGELVDKLIREEAKRRGDLSPPRPTSVGGR